MTVVRNAIANYIGQLYVIVSGILVAPIYLAHIGAEGYGLVGFFTMMQTWLMILDLGMSPTLSREAAHARGVENGFEHFNQLLKSFESIFLLFSLAIFLLLWLSSNWISTHWIDATRYDASTLAYCVTLLGLTISFRFFAGLYRAGITGMEDQLWLNGITVSITSIRYFGSALLVANITSDIVHFFQFQVAVGLIEVAVLCLRFYRRLPVIDKPLQPIGFNGSAVKRVAPFAAGTAYTAAIWILITQTDKMALSAVLPLSEFGYFTLVALVAGTITTLSGPISQAIMPRLTVLLAQDRQQDMVSLYRQSSRVATLVSLSVACTLGLYAAPLVYAWTGSRSAADWSADVLIWFAIGNAVLSIGAFQYYLQSAHGNLRLHVVGSSVSALVQAPLIYFGAIVAGAYGAGVTWLLVRIVWFLAWSPIVHRRFLPGFHIRWLIRDIVPVAVIVFTLSFVLYQAVPIDIETSRFLLFAQIMAIGIALLVGSASIVRLVRKWL